MKFLCVRSERHLALPYGRGLEVAAPNFIQLPVQSGGAVRILSTSSAIVSSGRTGKVGSERGVVAASQFTSLGLLAGEVGVVHV